MDQSIPHIEAFLEDQADDGTPLGRSGFTLNRAAALSSLARRSLGMPGSWLLKLVQAAVTSGCQQGIVVTATARSTTFRFDTDRVWSSLEVREALGDPEPCADESLQHLKLGLWGAGHAAQHPFAFTLSDSSEALVWQGEGELQEQPCPPGLKGHVTITVENRKVGDQPLGYSAERRRAAAVNAQNAWALANYAYTCPVPLTLDGRRLDSLLLAPAYFAKEVSQPVELVFLQLGLPGLRLPPGTFEAFRKRPYTYTPPILDSLTAQAATRQRPLDEASLAIVYVAHIGMRALAKISTWQGSKAKSRLRWVKDGVLVGEQEFAGLPTALSFACYASAKGLATDLTTLALSEGAGREARLAQVKAAVSCDLLKQRAFHFEDVVAGSRTEDRVAGAVTLAMGIVTLVALPVGLYLIWNAHRVLSQAGDQVQGLVDEVVAGYEQLQAQWLAANPEDVPPPLP